GRVLVLPYRDPGPAHAAVLQPAHDEDHQDDGGQGQVVVGLGVEHAVLQGLDVADAGGMGYAGDAPGAAGEGQVVGRDPDDLAEAQRHDGQVVAPQAQGGSAQDDAGDGGGGDAGGEDGPEAPVLVHAQQGHGVAADGEEGDVTEVEQAGLAHHDVQAHGQKDVDGDGEEQDRLPIAGRGHDAAHGVGRRQHRDDEHGQPYDPLAPGGSALPYRAGRAHEVGQLDAGQPHARSRVRASPSRPVGRSRRTPSRKVSRTTLSMLTPISTAVSGSWAVARMPRPSRVRATKRSSTTMSTRAATTTRSLSLRTLPSPIRNRELLAMTRGNAMRSRP